MGIMEKTVETASLGFRGYIYIYIYAYTQKWRTKCKRMENEIGTRIRRRFIGIRV